MSDNLGSAVSHAFLFASSAWAIYEVHHDPWGFATFALHGATGVCGVLLYIKGLISGEGATLPPAQLNTLMVDALLPATSNDAVQQIYASTLFLTTLTALPCFATDMYLNSSYGGAIAYLHIGFCVIPLLQWTTSDDYVKSIYDTVWLITFLAAVPCVATDVYLNSSYQLNIDYLHIGLGIVPFLKRYLSRGANGKLDTLILFECASVGYLAIKTKNRYALGAAFCYAISYFGCDEGREVDWPRFMCCMAVFNYLAVKAIGVWTEPLIDHW